ncbi:hypothetical protein CEP54_004604 [Fusarium duplospermum]|uniref:Uncharacterized protein n=1 Tax=Fusarium duplospermum TaxID=1325734 RepID=A0A428QHL0_9HYPO|nr:hypothetical protein CEP54_004604 [Fusarium duplospermum]
MLIEHFPIQPRCGACGDSIRRLERVVALRSNQDATVYAETTRPFLFPPYGTASLTLLDERLICRRDDCGACAQTPELVTVHYDCYHIFIACSKEALNLEEDKAVERLWTLSLYRNPWPKAELICFVETHIDLSALPRLAGIADLPQLTRLPVELVMMIRKFSLHELFWRSISVIALSSRPLSPLSISKLPLNHVLSWKRGEPLLLTPYPQTPPFVRITIDIEGICQVERPHEPTPFTGETFNELAFFVNRVANTSQIYVKVKDNRLRLCLPENLTGLATWNTDNPPAPSTLLDTRSLSPIQNGYWQLCAFDLNRCFGVSFFLSFGQLFGVYVHRSDDSGAADAYRRACESRRRMVWIYMPISPDDQVTVLGCRLTDRGFNILARMDLAGEVILGRLGVRTTQDRLLGYGTPLTLIYGEPTGQQRVPVIGTRHGTSGRDRLPAPFSMQDFRPDVDDAYFSWAPLDSIQSIRSFYDKDTGLCRGLIFQYENGGLRAVGECRKHVDDDVLAVKPSVICFQPAPNLASWRAPEAIGVRVELGNDIDHKHKGEGWECLRIGHGVLTFSFTEDSSSISHRSQLP